MNCGTSHSRYFLSLAALIAAVFFVDSYLGAACVRVNKHPSAYSFSYGNSTVSVDGRFQAGASLSSPDCPGTPSAVVEASGSANLRVFGRRYTFLDSQAEVSNTSRGSNVILHVEMGPRTLIDIDNPHHRSWSRSSTITLLRASRTVYVAGVPIQLSVSVGVGIRGNLQLQPAYPVQLSGGLSAWATGTAGAYLNASILRVGVRSTLNLLNTSLNSNMALALNRASGGVSLNVRAVRILVRLVVDRRTCRRRGWRLRCSWRELGGVTVVDYSRGNFTRTLLSN